MNKNTLFISHATPEDNDFTIWLASRLELLGYEVWLDKNVLLGGEKFWETIDTTIRNKTIKFLLVYSQNIFQKDIYGFIIPGKLKDGIYKEFGFAESIGKNSKIDDFIIMLNLDNSDYNLFIGADSLNQISFHENWADGLKQLERKLKKDLIPKKEFLPISEFGEWYQSQYITTNGITEKNELYYSNWWPIEKLPVCFYIYQFQTEKLARKVYIQDLIFPISKISNNLSSFQFDISFTVDDNGTNLIIKPLKTHKIKITDVLLGIDSENFPNQKDAENHLKQLLARIFHLIMKKRGMFWYEMSNKKQAYFFTPANLNSLKVKFKYPFKKSNKYRTKNLIGKYKALGKWHFAVSVKPIIIPVIAFSMKSHLTFTDDGFKVWQKNNKEIDKDRIHSQRRAKGKRLFNEEWRDMLLAFIEGLKKDGNVELRLSKDFLLIMPSYPLSFWADFGYYDPKDKTRHGLLSEYEYEDENEDKEYEIIPT
jgi:hypothetical protein